MGSTTRKTAIEPEHLAESQRLKAIWDNRKAAGTVGSQQAFGERYGIGNQAAVWQCLNGAVKISKKQAAGFALGLQCAVADFSPRLAAEIAALQPIEAPVQPPPDFADRREVSASDWAEFTDYRDAKMVPRLAAKLAEVRAELAEFRDFARGPAHQATQAAKAKAFGRAKPDDVPPPAPTAGRKTKAK